MKKPKQRKKINFQHPMSNRHNQPLTTKDRLKINNTYQDYRVIFSGLPQDVLMELQKTKLYDGKVLNGAKLRALNDQIILINLTNQIKKS